MRLHQSLLLFILVSLTMSNCGHTPPSGFTIAENLMRLHPDSALSVLTAMPASKNENDNARRALLLTVAQDRNYITPANDSLVAIACEYYQPGSYERMTADYYAGRINFRNKNYDAAVKHFLDAEESALARKDHFHLGFIYRDMAHMFNIVNDDANELQYARKAYDCFRHTGDSVLIKWGALDYGRALSISKKTLQQGRELLDSLIAAASTNDPLDLMLRADARRINIGAQFLVIFTKGGKRPEKFDFVELERRFMDDIPDDFFRKDTPNDGLPADYYSITPLSSGAIMRLIAEPYCREIHRRLNNLYLDCYHREYAVMDSAFQAPETYLDNGAGYSLAVADEYLTQRHSLLIEKEKNARQRLTLTLWVIVLLSLIAIATYIIFKIRNRKRQDRMIAEASELRSMLKSKDQSLNGLQDYIDELYGEKFNMVEELCDMFILPSKHPSEQKRIYDTVRSIVDGFKMEGDRISEIENFVNKYKDNVATDFKEDFPGLPQRDYILFLYSAAGFSRQAISYLMGDNVDVVSNRKTRLKKRFIAFDGANRNRYIDALK
ncbi:MAG: hypothetical protein HDS29_06215 [Bacteroides sp.]|nr:hypothetical protein [Bacteroides sp.]